MLHDRILGVDIGGSGMKAAPVDVANGRLLTERLRIDTPQPARPDTMQAVFGEIVRHFEWTGPIGSTFPGVIRRRSVVETAANLDKSWIGVDAAELFGAAAGSSVVMINDADAAGLAEMRHGAGAGIDGVVFMLTIGTGLGTALFTEGHLVPNTELGHLIIDGLDAEERASSRARKRDGMSVSIWAMHLGRYLAYVEDLLSPDVIIVGGGISKSFDEFAPLLDTRARLVPAAMRNHAGIIGAAMAAAG